MFFSDSYVFHLLPHFVSGIFVRQLVAGKHKDTGHYGF